MNQRKRGSNAQNTVPVPLRVAALEGSVAGTRAVACRDGAQGWAVPGLSRSVSMELLLVHARRLLSQAPPLVHPSLILGAGKSVAKETCFCVMGESANCAGV